MKLKKAMTLALTICISMLFCGCDLFSNTHELVSPPALTGEMAPIADALYEAVGTELTLEHPAAGKHRAAIVLEDINNDGKSVAFAFYSTSEDEMTTMHINVICQEGSSWKSVTDQTIVATGVDRVDFCDLNHDGVKEILVGWDVNGISEKQLSVFTFDQKFLTQRLLQAYSGFLCCDLDSNGSNELFVHLLNTSEKTNTATLYSYGADGITQISSCQMDNAVKSATDPVLSTLWDGTRAIYIDEIKGVGAITEVLFISKGEIVNPLLENSIENVLTLRAASLMTKDINGDGRLEIPTATDLPNAIVDGEKLYYTNWCTFDGKSLSARLITVVNTVDGYYFEVPKALVGKMAVLKDIEKHKREFYYYDSATQTTGDLLFTVMTMSAATWDSRDFNRGSFVELQRKDNNVFVADVSASAKAFGIDSASIKETFNLIT